MENISIKLRVANKGLTQVVDYVQGTNTIPIVFDIVDYNIPGGTVPCGDYTLHFYAGILTDVT